jgi:hypothetical protein
MLFKNSDDKVSRNVCLDPKTNQAESSGINYDGVELAEVSEESVRLVDGWLELKCRGSLGGRSGLIGVYRVKKGHILSPLLYWRSIKNISEDRNAPKIIIDGTKYVKRIFEKYCIELVNRKYSFYPR